MAIPTKAKNLLLIPTTDGGISQFFNMPGFSGYDSNNPNHNGLDIGWDTNPYCNVLACQDGKVVDVIYNDVSGSRGNGVVLQHDYEDGTHRWTGYIHLKNSPTVKVGQTVKQGEVIGVRGGSPYVNGAAKYGVHVHLYTTKAVTAAYTWNTMKANVIDPLPLLYRSKKIDYNVLMGILWGKPYLEDSMIEVVAPVERNPLENQLSESTSYLRVRTSPSLSGSIIGYLQQNKFYNWYEMKKADEYEWYKIADNQWVAKTESMTIYPKKDELEIAKEEIEKLTKANEELQAKIGSLAEEKSLIEKARDLLQDKISKVIAILTGED